VTSSRASSPANDCPEWCLAPVDHLDWPWQDSRTKQPVRVHEGDRWTVDTACDARYTLTLQLFALDRQADHGLERHAPLIALTAERAELTAADARKVAAQLLNAADELERLNPELALDGVVDELEPALPEPAGPSAAPLPGTAAELLDRWAKWMRFEGLRPRTIKHRTETMALFAHRGLDIAGASTEDLVEFVDAMNDAHGPTSASTRSNRHRVLRAWFLWLVRTEVRADNPLDRVKAPKVPQSEPRPCSSDDVARVLDRCRRRRTRVMILLAAYAGLRVHEIAKVRGEDIRGDWLFVTGKGGVSAKIPLHQLIAAEAPRMPRTGWWFPSYSRPGPITSQNVSTVIADAMARAGVDATAHQLRHWFGTEGLRSAGGNIRVAQQLLRHANISSTAIYTRVDDDETTAAVAGLPVTDLGGLALPGGDDPAPEPACED
jgi:integrase/recombinase XerD